MKQRLAAKGWSAVNVSFVLPMICFVVIAIYGYRVFKQKI